MFCLKQQRNQITQTTVLHSLKIQFDKRNVCASKSNVFYLLRFLGSFFSCYWEHPKWPFYPTLSANSSKSSQCGFWALSTCDSVSTVTWFRSELRLEEKWSKMWYHWQDHFRTILKLTPSSPEADRAAPLRRLQRRLLACPGHNHPQGWTKHDRLQSPATPKMFFWTICLYMYCLYYLCHIPKHFRCKLVQSTRVSINGIESSGDDDKVRVEHGCSRTNNALK